MITHVAIRAYGKVWSLPRPFRHHDVIRHIAQVLQLQSRVEHGPDDQGFLIDGTIFVGRITACVHAENCGQLNKVREKTSPKHVLFSEDVW